MTCIMGIHTEDRAHFAAFNALSYLACALGEKACRDGFSVVYRRTPRLFDELAVATPTRI